MIYINKKIIYNIIKQGTKIKNFFLILFALQNPLINVQIHHLSVYSPKSKKIATKELNLKFYVESKMQVYVTKMVLMLYRLYVFYYNLPEMFSQFYNQ